MRALGLLAVLGVLAALAYGSEVYVFKVWLPQPYSGFGIYVPGAKWELGEAAWLFMAPVERGEAVYALTGNITEAKLYDTRVVYIAIPATKPARVTKADAWLETAVSRYPVRIGKSHGLTLTLVDNEEEVYKVLREAGYSPKYMGEATLVEGEGKLPEPLRPEPLTTPSAGSTYRVYGGVYFVPTRVSVGNTVVIKPHAQSGLQVCSNVTDAAFVGYDAEEMTLGVYILGGSVRGRLVVEVYAMESVDLPAPCRRLGRWEAGLVNRSIYTVPYVNASVSRDKPLAVKVYVRADSVSGSPRVSVNASVAYSRTYRYGFEMSEYMTYTTGEAVTINQYVSRVVFGPYLIPDGIATGRHEVKFDIVTRPESGTCPPIFAEWFINGVWVASNTFYSYSSTSTGYRYTIAFAKDGLETTGLWFAKPFAGAFYYVVRLRYSGSVNFPYVYSIVPMPHEALRGWRWAEVWRTVPSSTPPLIWLMPFTASEVQVLYTRYPPQSSTTVGPLALVHGVFSLRNTAAGSRDFFQVTVAGGQYTGVRIPLRSFSITMRFSTSISGALLSGAYYATPAGPEEIKEPIWIFYAKLIKTAIDFGINFIGLGTLGSLLYQGFSFAVDKALESAVTQPTLSILDSYTLKISWTRGWADNHPSDKMHIYISLPPGNMLTTTPTTVTVRELKLEYVTYTPNLQWYIHPTDDATYSSSIPQQPRLKIWMLGGLTSSAAIYKTN